MQTMINDSSQIIFLVLIAICFGLIALITAIGNIIVLLAFYYDKKLRTINDYFIMNMAIADFLVGFFCIPFYIPFSIKQSWPFGRLFCKIWVTVDDVATMASVINIVAISVNRYWLIAYPISYRKYVRKDFVYLVMAFIWCLSFINFAPGIWLINLFDKTIENRNDCSGDYNRSFIYMLIAQFNYFIWPFIVLCILNILIMLNIWKRTRKMNHFRSFQLPKNNQQKSQISLKSSNENKKYFSEEKSYQSKINSFSSNPGKIFVEICKSSSNNQENKTSIIEQYSPIIQSKHQTIKLFHYLNKSNKLNVNSSKDRRSSPAVPLSIKSQNLNSRILRNCSSDSNINYHLEKEIKVIKSINNQIKENVCISQRDLRINRDRKAARSLFILVIVFLIFLFPYVICATASTAGFHISSTIFQISFWLLWINSTCNPFLYPFIQKKYRRAYVKLFQSCFKQF